MDCTAQPTPENVTSSLPYLTPYNGISATVSGEDDVDARDDKNIMVPHPTPSFPSTASLKKMTVTPMPSLNNSSPPTIFATVSNEGDDEDNEELSTTVVPGGKKNISSVVEFVQSNDDTSFPTSVIADMKRKKDYKGKPLFVAHFPGEVFGTLDENGDIKVTEHDVPFFFSSSTGKQTIPRSCSPSSS